MPPRHAVRKLCGTGAVTLILQPIMVGQVEKSGQSYDIEIVIQGEIAMRTKPFDPETIDLDYLKQEFNRFRSELSGMKEKLGGNASDALDQMSAFLNGSGVSSRLSNLESEFEALAGKLKGSGKQAVTRVEAKVVERPMASIAIAFGVGLLAAQLIRRS